MSTKEEKEAAKAAKQAEKDAAKAAKEAAKAANSSGIDVGDPLALRPVDLPLVVKPSNGGEWKNEAQARFAATLNAYAYKNPAKWASKKEVLIAQLIEIGENPAKAHVLSGGESKLSYKNKLIEQ